VFILTATRQSSSPLYAENRLSIVKAYILSAAAEADLLNAHAYYLELVGDKVANDFMQQTEIALHHLQSFPGTGSNRYAHMSPHAHLCFWTLKRFPYALFYIERETVIDIVRVLHQASDIPFHLDARQALPSV
jgi:toxin ParE1/3/4